MKFTNVNQTEGFTTTLADGEAIDLRPIQRDDWQTIEAGMSALSSQSRYFRFFSSLSQLSNEQLHYFTHVDQRNHIAWLALAHDSAEHPGVGVARFIRFQKQLDIAEFAVVVIDRYQKRGIGTLLMATLYLMASIRSIKILRGFVLPENTVTLRWLKRLGAVSHFENGLYRMDIAVHSDRSMTPSPPLLNIAAGISQQIDDGRASLN